MKRRRRGALALASVPPNAASRRALCSRIKASRPAWTTAVFSRNLWIKSGLPWRYGGRRMSSRDGIHWTNDTEWAAKGGDDDNVLFNVAFAKGKFIAVGGSMTGRIVTTTDGKMWTEQPKVKWRVPVNGLILNDVDLAGAEYHALPSPFGPTQPSTEP